METKMEFFRRISRNLGPALGLSIATCEIQTLTAVPITIDFDTVVADGNIATKQPLRNEFAPQGVHFAGATTASLAGGAIVNFNANFSSIGPGGFIPAHSGNNFLGFNRTKKLANGAFATDPEVITFDFEVDSVSIFANAGNTLISFTIEAFELPGDLTPFSTFINSSTEVAPYDDDFLWIPLSVNSTPNKKIRQIRISSNQGIH